MIKKTVAGEALNKRMVRSTLILMASTVISGALGYLFQVIMGRMLPPEEYGPLASFMAWYGIMATPIGSLMLISCSHSLKINGRLAELQKLTELLLTKSFIYTTIFSGAALTAILFLPNEYGLNDFFFFLPILLLLNIVPNISNGLFQSQDRFKLISIILIVLGVSKVIFPSILVGMGFSIFGAIYGLIASLVVTNIASSFLVKKFINIHYRFSVVRKSIGMRDSVRVIAANASYAVVSQIDILFSGFLFTPYEVGIYAGASIMGKALLYLSGSVSLSLFPLASQEIFVIGKRSTLIRHALIIVGVISLLGSFTYYIIGSYLIEFLYGNAYLQSENIIKYYGFVMTPYGMLYVIEHFMLAKNKLLTTYICSFGSILFIIIIMFKDLDTFEYAIIYGLIGFLMLLISMLFLLKNRFI